MYFGWASKYVIWLDIEISHLCHLAGIRLNMSCYSGIEIIHFFGR
jgi:hypothetical protein